MMTRLKSLYEAMRARSLVLRAAAARHFRRQEADVDARKRRIAASDRVLSSGQESLSSSDQGEAGIADRKRRIAASDRGLSRRPAGTAPRREDEPGA